MNTSKLLLTLIAGVAAGAATGAALGVLYAPAKGTITRKRMLRRGRNYAGDLKDQFDEIKDQFNETIDSINDSVESVRDGVGKLMATGKDAGMDLANRRK